MTQMKTFCITKLVSGGRPTNDPKETLVAVRLSDRQRVVLERRVQRESISLSEAIRRCVDEWDRGYTRARPASAAEHETFKLLAKAFGARRRPRSRKR